MVAEHQQEWFVSHGCAGAVDGVTKAFLCVLNNKGDMPSDLQEAAGIFLELGWQLIVIFDGYLLVEQEAKLFQVVFLNNNDHFLNPGLQGFLDYDEDGRFGNAIPVND